MLPGRAEDDGRGVAGRQAEGWLRLAGQREGRCAAASPLAAVQLQKVRGRIDELRRLEVQLADGLSQCRPEEDPIGCPVIDLLQG